MISSGRFELQKCLVYDLELSTLQRQPKLWDQTMSYRQGGEKQGGGSLVLKLEKHQ